MGQAEQVEVRPDILQQMNKVARNDNR